MKRKIYFEDKGQDFLWWIIDEFGLVIDCGPFQGFVWIGSTVDLDTIKEGSNLCLETDSVGYMMLKHKVESIEVIE